MNGKRLIAILVILSMIVGFIGSASLVPGRGDHFLRTEGRQDETPLSRVDRPHGEIGAAVYIPVRTCAPIPFTPVQLFWPVVASTAGLFGVASLYRIGPSPPFMASGRRHTYLSNSVLLI